MQLAVRELDFSQVFQGKEREKMEDNWTSADLLCIQVNGSQVKPGNMGKRLLVETDIFPKKHN